jgi:hypothetical protein
VPVLSGSVLVVSSVSDVVVGSTVVGSTVVGSSVVFGPLDGSSLVFGPLDGSSPLDSAHAGSSLGMFWHMPSTHRLGLHCVEISSQSAS